MVTTVEASRDGAGLAGAAEPEVERLFSASGPGPGPGPAAAAAAAVDCLRKVLPSGRIIDGEEKYTNDQAGSCFIQQGDISQSVCSAPDKEPLGERVMRVPHVYLAEPRRRSSGRRESSACCLHTS